MSTINQIQLPNGSTYDFEDTVAREAASSKADKTLATSSANGLMSASDKSKLDGIDPSAINTINTHIANKANPHGVTKAQVGLGYVANLDQSKAIKSIARDGTTFTATSLDGTVSTFTQQDTNTTYDLATSSADGLMSAEDKKAIDREFFRMLPKGGTEILNGADLNSTAYLKVGIYYQTGNVHTTNMTNIPDKAAFMMYVLSPLSEVYDNESTAQKVYRLRIFVEYTGDYIFTQTVYSYKTAGSFTYGPWVKITNSNDLDAVSNTINTHIAKKSNPHKVTKDQVGLGSVANLDQSKAIKSITRSGTTFTATALDGTTTTFTQQDSSTTYSVATSSADGLMSAADKSKLDGIGAGSNVKSVNDKTGAVSLSKADVGLGNVDNTSDADKPYYKLIGKTESGDQIGHFKFNDARRSLYKIKNFYAASGEGDHFYLAHKKLDYTITATKHFSNIAGLFTADLTDDCTIATDLISESDPAILTIVRKDNNPIANADDLTLIFYEDAVLADPDLIGHSIAKLKHWKLETMVVASTTDYLSPTTWEWKTVFERSYVSDNINCLWCGLGYGPIKGIRITIYAATPTTTSWEFEYSKLLKIAGMRLLDSRPLFSPAEALGALDVAGGTVYGETTFQEGISATSYSGATATSSDDGLMSKSDKAKLDGVAYQASQLAKNTAQIETAGTATNAHSVGEYVMISNALYKVRLPVAKGTAWATGTNVTAANVGNEIASLKSNLANHSALHVLPLSDIADAQNGFDIRFCNVAIQGKIVLCWIGFGMNDITVPQWNDFAIANLKSGYYPAKTGPIGPVGVAREQTSGLTGTLRVIDNAIKINTHNVSFNPGGWCWGFIAYVLA